MASDDRTEAPTFRRLREARRKGQLPRSREVADAAQLVAVTVALGWLGPGMLRGLASAMRHGLDRMGVSAQRTVGAGDLTLLATDTLGTVWTLVGPLAGVAIVAAVGVSSLQGGWNVATEAVRLDFGKLNPAAGLERLGFQRGGLDLVRMAVVVGAIGWLCYRVVRDTVHQAPLYGLTTPAGAAALGWTDALRLLRDCAVALVVFALGDYALARWRHVKGLRMTKQEVKDDLRLTEGSPETKGRIRRKQREVARRRMLASVPKATVVITNPTHYAVALEYRRDAMSAPRVLAKGRGLIAARIKAIAREHGVPIVENVALAQALYRTSEVGDLIPAELFGAVAEILAYLIRLKQLVL
jgi:flagellar biosynthetic protein FlhB